MTRSLERAVAESTPLLERALRSKEEPRYDTELQLRGSVCGLATAALQIYFQEQYDITLERRLSTPKKAPRGLNSRLLRHVGLFKGEDMVDPTYGQFFTYVGLSQAAAQTELGLRMLFPVDKIAVIPKRQAHSFADSMAAHMHAVESEVARRRPTGLSAYPPENSLVGSSLADKQKVLHDIWNPNGYNEPFPIEDQSGSFQRRALSLVERMHELEHR